MSEARTFVGESAPARGAAAPLPTREQLLRLIDRAEQHVLTTFEAHQLRLGLAHLAGQLAGAGKAIRRLTAELESARQVAASSGPLSVACRYCGAAAGVACRPMSGAELPRGSHTARLSAAGGAR